MTTQQREPRRLRKATALPTADTIVQLINEGNLDDSIRKIVRACFYRREVLYGDGHVIPDDPQPEKVSRSPLGTIRKRPSLGDVPAMHEWFMAGGGEEILPNSVKPRKASVNHRVLYRNQEFDKCDFTGKRFRIPSGSLVDSDLGGVLVGIVGVGNMQVKTLLLEKPPRADSNADEKWREHTPYFIPVRRLFSAVVDHSTIPDD